MRQSRILDVDDRDRVARILDANPVRNCFVASRLDLGLLNAGGQSQLWGYPSHDPYALLHVGTNLVPVNTDERARAAFVEDLGRWRSFISMVGPDDEVLPLWDALQSRWGEHYRRARVVRPRQLVMARSEPCEHAGHPGLCHPTAETFESYFAAAAAMYAEELLEDPLKTNALGYRTYVRSLVQRGRAYAIVDGREVLFKADVGAVSDRVAQIQGVWVRPDLRGRGLATSGMAAVTNAIVSEGLIASLYVNDFNAPAIGAYRSCGYEQVATFASVLF